MNAITINQSQQLFVIPCGSGFTTRGFRSLFVELGAILSRLGVKDPRADEAKIGTLEQYAAHSDALREVSRIGGFRDTWFDVETPDKVRKVLESARKDGTVIRVYYGDSKTGRDWSEENDVIGTVGRSGGLMKVPLLVPEGECGGPAMLDNRIVKIQRVSDGKVLYQHPTYQAPDLALHSLNPEIKGPKGAYTHEVTRDGETVARFRSLGAAAAYVAFMHGTSFAQPH